MVIKVFSLIMIISLTFAGENRLDDLAYQLVLEKIDKKVVPTSYIDEIFNNPSIEKHLEIPERFAKPYEKKSWEQYKKLFIKESRIVAGVKFYSENKDLVFQVSKKYDVDPFIILSIAGIESNYGRHYKGFTVFNSLYTQIHEMPKRAKWASNELASYLEYCYKDNVDPQSIEGSYAGAFGFGQFIPSSFNRYSVDFDDDGVRRPHDWPDVLGSIANYLRMNGYNANSSDYSKEGDIYKSVFAYNHADNYVMAVLELTEKIRERVTGKKNQSVNYSMETKTFEEAFAKAREELGPNKVFIWNNRRFSTNMSK